MNTSPKKEATLKSIMIPALLLCAVSPAYAFADAPNVEKLENMSFEDRVSCRVVNTAISKMVLKSGDKTHADAYAVRGLQFISNEEAGETGVTVSILNDLTDKMIDLANKEPESKIELRSIITQCDTWVEVEPIMPNTSK